MKLIRLTTNSWIVLSGTGPNVLIFKRKTDYLIMSPFKKEVLKSKEHVEKLYGSLDDKVRSREEKELTTLMEYPVKHDPIFPLEGEDQLPIYSKTQTSKSYFLAGYWVVYYEKYSWSIQFCPKLSILGEHPNHGPFRTKMEAEIEMKRLNNQLEKK